MSHLTVKKIAECFQQPLSRVMHEQSCFLVKPGRAGFAR